jgi:GNAT superfamily N-acetyltransferase/SAM-dependent methyltransferase
MKSMSQEYAERVRECILDGESFVRAVFSGRQSGATLEWVKVVVRPVQIKGALHWQVSCFDEAKDTTKNYTGAEAAGEIDALLALPFKNIHVETTAGGLEVRITKKGQALVRETASPEPRAAADLSHDHEKKRILSLSDSAPFLEAVGILTKSGKIKADRQGKFQQINEFLRLVEETGIFRERWERPVRIIDCGCGNAYLTFAIYHYVANILAQPADIVGIDVKADLLDRHREKARALGWDHLSFEVGCIADFQPSAAPDVVVALHACDTATDDALARGIRWQSRLIMSAPCCQHELQEQLSRTPVPESFRAVSRFGILGERLGDILTDTFRAAILRIMGYRTDVVQFVSMEHTAKNLMIRSVKTAELGSASSIEEYKALRDYWRISPYLERLLGDELAERLRNAEAPSGAEPNPLPLVIRPMQRGEDGACEAILRALPEWFGIEEALAGYARDLETLETWVADVGGTVAGFLTVKQHGPSSAEIRVMAVAPEAHGRGYGRGLMESAARALCGRGVEFLQVKTLSPSRPDARYERTRGFYERMGFRPLEETNEWGDHNPCLVMVKHLQPLP